MYIYTNTHTHTHTDTDTDTDTHTHMNTHAHVRFICLLVRCVWYAGAVPYSSMTHKTCGMTLRW